MSRVSENIVFEVSMRAGGLGRLNYPVMENEGLIRFLKGHGVVIEKPGDKVDHRPAEVRPAFTLEPLTDQAALQRGTVLGCLFALFVMAAAGLVLFAGVHALITGRAF
jgi:hypothetical protein